MLKELRYLACRVLPFWVEQIVENTYLFHLDWVCRKGRIQRKFFAFRSE